MKKIILFACILLTGCGSINKATLEASEEMCSLNGGVSYVFIELGRATAVCNNGGEFYIGYRE